MKFKNAFLAKRHLLPPKQTIVKLANSYDISPKVALTQQQRTALLECGLITRVSPGVFKVNQDYCALIDRNEKRVLKVLFNLCFEAMYQNGIEQFDVASLVSFSGFQRSGCQRWVTDALGCGVIASNGAYRYCKQYVFTDLTKQIIIDFHNF
jgi:hypothetical protein